MPLFTTSSITISAGTHGDESRLPEITSHIYEKTPDIIALEYNPDRLINYLEKGYKNGSKEYPIADIYLAIHAAADTNTPIALIDTATIPQNTDELYDETEINNAINYQANSPYDSRPYVVSRQAVTELRNRHPNIYISLLANRDQQMAGHLKYLTNNDLDVFAIVGGNHLPGIADRLHGIVPIKPQLITAPPIRTKLPALTESNATWVNRWLPNTTTRVKRDIPVENTLHKSKSILL